TVGLEADLLKEFLSLTNCGEAQPVFAQNPRRGFAEESSRQSCRLRAGPVGRADAPPQRRRPGDRQWRYGTSEPGHRHWPPIFFSGAKSRKERSNWRPKPCSDMLIRRETSFLPGRHLSP